MESVLEALYHGQLYPEEKSLNCGEEYKNAFRMIETNREKLDKLLNMEQKQLLSQLDHAYMTVDTTQSAKIFIQGFQLGAKIMLEAIGEK